MHFDVVSLFTFERQHLSVSNKMGMQETLLHVQLWCCNFSATVTPVALAQPNVWGIKSAKGRQFCREILEERDSYRTDLRSIVNYLDRCSNEGSPAPRNRLLLSMPLSPWSRGDFLTSSTIRAVAPRLITGEIVSARNTDPDSSSRKPRT